MNAKNQEETLIKRNSKWCQIKEEKFNEKDNRELKNHDDVFVYDDRNFVVVVVSSTTPNKVESRRPAIHKLLLI